MMNYLKIIPVILATSLVYAGGDNNPEGSAPGAAAKRTPPAKVAKPAGTPKLQSDAPKPGSVAERRAAMEAVPAVGSSSTSAPAAPRKKIEIPGALASLNLPGGGVPGGKPMTKAEIDAARGALIGHGTGNAAKNPDSPLHNDETRAAIEESVDTKANAGPSPKGTEPKDHLLSVPRRPVRTGTRLPAKYANKRHTIAAMPSGHQDAAKDTHAVPAPILDTEVVPAPVEAQVAEVFHAQNDLLQQLFNNINTANAAFDDPSDRRPVDEKISALANAFKAYREACSGK